MLRGHANCPRKVIVVPAKGSCVSRMRLLAGSMRPGQSLWRLLGNEEVAVASLVGHVVPK